MASSKPFMILGKEPSWSIPADIDPDRRKREILPPGSRGEVYARGMDMGCLFGIFYGLFVGGAIVAICFLMAPSWTRIMHDITTSQDREAGVRLEPSREERSQRTALTDTPPVASPSLNGETSRSRDCLRNGPNRPSGECCVPAGVHMPNPQRFRADPHYRGRGHWVCGGELETRAIRNRDGTTDVSRCNWCEP